MCGTIEDCLNCEHEECLFPDMIFDFEVDISRQNERQAVLLYPTKHFQHEAYNKRWKQENKAHVAAYNKKYRQENKEYYRDYQKKYAEGYKPIKKYKNKEYYRKNRERILAKDREKYSENREKILERHRAYREKNKEVINARRREKRRKEREKRNNEQGDIDGEADKRAGCKIHAKRDSDCQIYFGG